MVLTLMVPAEKVDAIRSKLTQYRTLSLGKEQKDVYQLGAVIGRQQSERGIKNQLDNRAYFGHVAPRDSVQREAIRARDIVAAPRGQSTLEEQKGGFADLDAAKVNAPPAGGARSLPANRSSLFSARTLKKQNEELVRLVIKLRTPPKPAPVKRKGKE